MSRVFARLTLKEFATTPRSPTSYEQLEQGGEVQGF